MNTSAVSTQRILIESHGQLARITLSYLPLNIIDFQMMDELQAALQQLEQNPEIMAVILSGSERVFSAGVDVSIHTPDKIKSMLQKFHGVIGALVKFSKITIAEVQGACLGGGAELAMVCDMVYTTMDAKWGFPEITLGCYPPVACAALAALVGQKRAADLIFTGRTFSGEEASAWGIANEAIEQGKLKRQSSARSTIFLSSAQPHSKLLKKLFMPGIQCIWIKVWRAQRKPT